MQPTVKLDLSQWTYRDFNRFMGSTVGQEDANLKFELADKILVSWTYETPISEGIEGLPTLDESLSVVAGIYHRIEEFTETVDTDGVVLEMTNWNLKRYREFNDIRKDGNYRQVEKMLHEVAKLPGTTPDEPLSATEGARMMKAVSDHITKALTGKV